MMKKRKGEKVRPCVRSEAPVRFLKGEWTAFGRQRRGWHWTNAADGSHHRCSDYMETGVDKWEAQWKQAMARDSETTEREFVQ